MQNKDIVNYLIALFKIDNPYIINDLIEDIETLHNKDNLIPFIKEKMNYQNFKFLNSFEKLTALIADFKKENKLKLDENTGAKVDNYSKKLFDMIIDFANRLSQKVFDENLDLTICKWEDTFRRSGFDDKDMKIINEIGCNNVYRYCFTEVEFLKNKILEIVNKKALEKQYPQLANKNNFEGIETIKKLQKVSNSNTN